MSGQYQENRKFEINMENFNDCSIQYNIYTIIYYILSVRRWCGLQLGRTTEEYAVSGNTEARMKKT